jgi:hypothetical protein
MPFVYSLPSAVLAASFTSSATPDTEIEHQFIKPGARNIAIVSLLVGGKGAGLTALSGIAYRFKKWFTTAASAGTAATPAPVDPGQQACKATAGWTAAASVTAGTGGPTFLGGCVSGAAGPGGWVAENPDAMYVLEGTANQSVGLWSASGTASMKFECTTKFQE